MSRRARKRSVSSSGGSSRLMQWSIRLVLIFGVVAILSGFGVYFWLKSYLHSDGFRVFIGDVVGASMGSEAEFELFNWQGMQANTNGFSSKSGDVIDSLSADGVEATLSLSGVSRGVWEISDVRVNKLNLVVDQRGDEVIPTSDTPKSQTKVSKKQSAKKGLLPDRAEVLSADIASADMSVFTDEGAMTFKDVSTRIKVGNTQGMYDLDLRGGVIESSLFDSKIDLKTLNGRYQSGKLYINDFTGEVYDRGLLTLDGEVGNDGFGIYAQLNDVRVEELISENWQKRLTGDLSTECKITSSKGDSANVELKGKVELKNGVLTALPLLDRIAAYANTERFRRINLSEARMNFSKQGDELSLTNIVIASEGLMRIKGDFHILSGQLDGRFRVGIMPGLLAHIPGAETKIFLRGEDGLLWTRLRVTGTLDRPSEDLSERMIAAAYDRMFEFVPETGVLALKFAHETATDLPTNLLKNLQNIEGSTESIREGADVIKSGVEEGLGGFLNLIP